MALGLGLGSVTEGKLREAFASQGSSSCSTMTRRMGWDVPACEDQSSFCKTVRFRVRNDEADSVSPAPQNAQKIRLHKIHEV